ncbi:MAG: hypothetical protein HUJ25_15450 [Crocinitomicaceae bacterium]|nr:hypothetical protein [Crocinitomicaceae bacterium]
MKKKFIILLIILLGIPAKLLPQEQRKIHFAIGFFTGAHSQMITYAFVTTFRGKIVGSQIVRKDRFIYTALGHWPHNINPNRENLFEKFGVDSCFLVVNERNKVVGYYAKPFDELWKIRFYEHPYEFDRPGWSQGQYVPSIYQKEFLKREYGLNNILTDYIYGDSLFKLLRNVQNPGWVVQYKTASRDTTSGP